MSGGPKQAWGKHGLRGEQGHRGPDLTHNGLRRWEDRTRTLPLPEQELGTPCPGPDKASTRTRFGGDGQQPHAAASTLPDNA